MSNAAIATTRSDTAYQQGWRQTNPRALLHEIIATAEDPYDRDAIYEEFEKRRVAEMDPSIRLDWLDSNYASVLRGFGKPGQTSRQLRAKREAIRERIRHSVAKRFDAVIEKEVVLALTTMMPIGKAFGDCTGSELRAMREHLPKALDAVIDKVGDDQMVRKVLTGKVLAKLNLRLG